jgi:hypothetical protein
VVVVVAAVMMMKSKSDSCDTQTDTSKVFSPLGVRGSLCAVKCQQEMFDYTELVSLTLESQENKLKPTNDP